MYWQIAVRLCVESVLSMLEKYLIEHCAPTLASLKTASLFSYHAAQDPEDDVKHLNRIFRDKGVELLILKREENAMLIYVCRRTQLAKDLERPGAKELLERYGYTDTSVDGAIERLRMRLASGDGFPHEIGLFLGYPVEDVFGFIENAGQNCKCCGCWKVYCNECEAVRTFARYKKCRDIYKRLWQEGRSVLQLTVAA